MPVRGKARVFFSSNPPGSPAVCDDETAVLSPDGKRVSCAVKGTAILVTEFASGATVLHAPFEPRYSTGERYPEWPLESRWSPDSRMLLIGNLGEHSGSSDHSRAYFLLDLLSGQWTAAFTGTDVVWLSSRLIVYVTPRGLSPFFDTARSVWTAHLTAYDPVTHDSRAITSGLSNDFDVAGCGTQPQRVVR